MIPVYQTIISDEAAGIHGNCFPACLASIMELPLEQIPDLQTPKSEWFNVLWTFLLKNGYEFLGTGTKEDALSYPTGIDGYYIVNGSSPRGFKRGHAVVFKNGVMVHDPHVSGLGVIDIWNYFMIERVIKE
jgi:hypothetical protein